MMRRCLLLLALGCAGLGVQSPASARVEAGSGYTKLQTFSAALRFLRVDRGYEILEKDPDAAYLLFRYPLPGQKISASGALEVVETERGVKFFVQLPRLPEYHESVLRDGLLKKLREEYGEPKAKLPPPKAKEPAQKPGDSDAKPDGPG